jgi:hypothetical protein
MMDLTTGEGVVDLTGDDAHTTGEGAVPLAGGAAVMYGIPREV